MRNKQWIYGLAIVVACGVFFSGCVKLGPGKPVEAHYYTLLVDRPDPKLPMDCGKIVRVHRLEISDIYDSREMVYRSPEGRVEADFYNRYFVSPEDSVTQSLRTWMDDSGLWKHVVIPASVVDADYSLEGIVNALYGDYRGNEPVAVVNMQFMLLDAQSEKSDVLFSERYKVQVPMKGVSADHLAEGLRDGLRQIFTSLEQDLVVKALTMKAVDE